MTTQMNIDRVTVRVSNGKVTSLEIPQGMSGKALQEWHKSNEAAITALKEQSTDSEDEGGDRAAAVMPSFC